MRNQEKNEGSFRPRRRRRSLRDKAVIGVFRCCAYGVLGVLALLVVLIFSRGLAGLLQASPPFLETAFFTEAPENLYSFSHDGEKRVMTAGEFNRFTEEEGVEVAELQLEVLSYAAGGILPAIVGTVMLVLGTMVITLGLGGAAAIYLSEFSRDSRFIRLIRLAILNLAGVPSIIYGLFGLGVFVFFLGWGQSLLAGWFTLAILALPLVITAGEEALRAVPYSVREASLSLGASRWQTIWKNVLPQALPGLLTSTILTMVRVAGETAPILFTAALAFRETLPWEGDPAGFFLQGVMALPYHLYIVATRLPQEEATQMAQYGTAMTFLLLLFIMSFGAALLRRHYRKKLSLA
ncbi:MAG: phosphate ABC transporter permease PstA [Verrucomicrobia bacterium]|jgi:phosphate transport system permease protein|nr:phosphate ABC transporter permease PstA [Verrucomicrobiota bacterium]